MVWVRGYGVSRRAVVNICIGVESLPVCRSIFSFIFKGLCIRYFDFLASVIKFGFVLWAIFRHGIMFKTATMQTVCCWLLAVFWAMLPPTSRTHCIRV